MLVLALGPLTIRDLRRVRDAVWPARAQWRDIGLEIGFLMDDLDNIEGRDNGSQLTDMLATWLKRQESLSPSRGKLVKALKSNAVQREDIARKVTEEDPNIAPGTVVAQKPNKVCGTFVMCRETETFLCT